MKKQFTTSLSNIMKSKEVTKSEGLVLEFLLENYKNSKKRASQIIYDDEIIEETGLSRRTIVGARKKLESIKLIKVEKVKKGRAMLNTYSFDWRRLETLRFIKGEFNPFKPPTKTKMKRFSFNAFGAPKKKEKVLTPHNLGNLDTQKEYKVRLNKLHNGKASGKIGEKTMKGQLLINMVKYDNDIQYTQI
tara:strand:+ start:1537 stop:2106 length:570 start_codon:yes stop_codon:yes gene_type:complete